MSDRLDADADYAYDVTNRPLSDHDEDDEREDIENFDVEDDDQHDAEDAR